MKMAKKLLAVALAGVLALSVLTGCGKDSATAKTLVENVAKAGIKVEYSKDLDKTAEATLKVLDAEIAKANTPATPAAQDAEAAAKTTYENVLKAAKTSKEFLAAVGTDANGANAAKKVVVAVVKLNDKKDQVTQAYAIAKALENPTDGDACYVYTPAGKTSFEETGKMGSKIVSSKDYAVVVVTYDAKAEKPAENTENK